MYRTNGFVANLLMQVADNPKHESYADGTSYLDKFRAMESTFFENVHPLVDIGLAIREVRVGSSAKPNIFTTHGCRHIADLIKSLDKLSEAVADVQGGRLSVLEAYILLCAAHVHDAANVKKREGHPERCIELIDDYKTLFASSAAIQQVYQVASVHGGTHPTYGKDTIRSLDLDNTGSPRLPLLAALLRFADELSENAQRVPELVAKHHDHSDASKLAFAYARSFQNYELRKDTLYLTFGVSPDDAGLHGTVNSKSVSFFDFLEAKLDVIDREARYCSQYGWPVFHIARVHVFLHVYKRPLPTLDVDTLNFAWQLYDGYPSQSEAICQRSPELRRSGHRYLADFFREPLSRKEKFVRAFRDIRAVRGGS